jgi:hypothetical protein
MSKLTTAAWAAHNLGLGATLGGLLFGKLSFNPKLEELNSDSERGKILNKVWNRYNVFNAISLGTAALTWFAGRAGISGDSLDDDGRNLVLTKDLLFVAAIVSGLASMVSGIRLSQQAPDGAVPIQSGTEPNSNTPEEAVGLLRTVNVLGNVNIALIAAIDVVSTILSMKAIRSTRWSEGVSRFLP